MKKIIVFIDWFLPGYKAGGQIPSVANIIRLLGEEIQFSVITSDRDDGNHQPYQSVALNRWTEHQGIRTFYLTPEKQKLRTLKKILDKEEFDALYFNSFFSFRFTLLPLLTAIFFFPKKQLILAPRGMLGKGALQIKPVKKRLFLALSKLLGLYKRIVWHASSELEKQEIQAIFGKKQDIRVALDISVLPSEKNAPRQKKTGEVRFFFLSRITHKKNLHTAIELIQSLKGEKIIFDIIGPIDDQKYWQECQKKTEKKTENIEINYLGSIPKPQIEETISGYHFMVLPTFNENYGHVIAEALNVGCPVVLSDNTPWRNLQTQGAGWDIPLAQTDRWHEILQKCTEMSQEDFNRLSAKAASFAREKLSDPALLESNRKVFL